MGKFSNIMIVTDLDDTFLGEGGKYVDRNLEAIDYFKKNGGYFTAATGRDHYFVTAPMPELVELCNAPIITSNGACIYDKYKNTIERVEALPTQKTLEVIRDVLEFAPELSCRVSLDNGYVYEREEKLIVNDKTTYRYLVNLGSFDNYIDRTWLKVVFFGHKDIISKATAYLKGLNDPGLHFVNAFYENVEILAPKATKGSKLAVLKDYMSLPDMRIAAIGDYYNDYEMISAADIPATVENGTDELKRIHGVYVTCNNREGAIADLIEYIERTVI